MDIQQSIIACLRKKNKILKEIETDTRIAESIYSRLLNSDNVETLVSVATGCLRIGILIDKSIDILQDIVSRKLGLITCRAHTVLDVYRGVYPGDYLR
jgi:hypothetical protein